MKTWKILREYRLKGYGVHHAMLGIARMHNLALAGQTSVATPRPTMPETTRRSFTGE